MTTNQTTTHQAPPAGQTLTPCCGRTIFDLLRTDRLTNNPDTITCDQAAAPDPSSVSPAADPSTGAALIAAERLRQVEAEGWTPEHDAQHSAGDLARAAACYLNAPGYSPPVRHAAVVAHGPDAGEPWAPFNWPWAARFWKPTPDDRVRELVKAGALVAAEIDRLVAAETPVAAKRPWTADEETAGGGKRITAKRACNGCGRLLGDVSDAEMDAVLAGAGLPDVRVECGCVDGDYHPVASETAAAGAAGPVTPAGACSGGCVSVERLTGALRALAKAGPWACMAIPPTLRQLAELLEASAGGTDVG